MIRTKPLLITFICFVGIMSCSTERTSVYTLTTTASPTEAGTITPESGSYDEGEVVNLQAFPNDGWVFLRWGEDLNSFANPTNVTMDREYTVVYFQQAGPRDTEKEVVDVTNPATGQTWMYRNLGASRVAPLWMMNWPTVISISGDGRLMVIRNGALV
ncbi:InlB B-repeat-containing protein [Rhodohalobacter sp. 8-1]|uniref:InlB B-repeat-containing protein n=1 Tax=Rhodohalobacter sp. 8-1 TaxID=3131972 RepID=UPI0030EE3547